MNQLKIMNARERAWKKLVETEKVQRWLNDAKRKTLQLQSKDFRSVGQPPVRMIPTYKSSEIPQVLRERGIETLRNARGGCLLVKVKDTGLPTLYPKLEIPEDQYGGPPFRPIPRLTVLQQPKSSMVNEETGIHLGWGLGVLQSFLMDCFSSHEEFSYMGRMKTTAKGEFRILGEGHEVDALVEVDGYFESDERIVVLEVKQSKSNERYADFSLHQILLPLMVVRSVSEKPSSGIFLDWSTRTENPASLIFYLHHYAIPGAGSSINPFDYDLDRSKIYEIHL